MLFYIRAVVLTVWFAIACLISLLVCFVRPFHRDNTHDCGKIFGLGRYGLGVKVRRLNSAPVLDQSVIYIANHQDTLDVFLYPSILPPNTSVLGKSGLRWIPLFGLAYWLAGNIFINRTNKQLAWQTMAEVANDIEKKRCSIIIFPEGTRNRGQGLLPFKRGAFVLAIQSGLPIVPICCSSTHRHIDVRRWHAGEMTARYLEPICTKGMTQEDVPALTARCQQLIEEGVADLDQAMLNASFVTANDYPQRRKPYSRPLE